jgi:hypothetical protein
MNGIGICAAAGAVWAATACAGDWPQFCGQDRNNVSPETGLASSWPETGPKVLWETEVSDGYSGPSIKDGKLIILDGKTGILYLVKADPAEYKQLACAKMVEENDMAWAPLALSEGKLLVRDWNTLKCVDLK